MEVSLPYCFSGKESGPGPVYQFSICGVSVITPWDPPGVGGRGGRCRDHIIDGPFSILRRLRGKGRWGGELGGLVEKEGKVMKELKEPKIIIYPSIIQRCQAVQYIQ